jgi:hypothetical protein
MPVVDDEDEEDVAERAVYPNEDLKLELEIEHEEAPLSAASLSRFNPEVFNDVSPRASSSSMSVFFEHLIVEYTCTNSGA